MGPIRIVKSNSIKPQQEQPLSLNHWKTTRKTTRKTAVSQCHSLSCSHQGLCQTSLESNSKYTFYH